MNGRDKKQETGEAGRGQIVQDIVNYGKEFRLFLDGYVEPCLGLSQGNGIIFVFIRDHYSAL